MAWGRLEDTLHDEPKFYRAASRLGITFVQVAGHMAILWSWAHRHASDGDLRDYDVPEIERAAKWDGENGLFVSVLADEKVNLLDNTSNGYVLHRFMDRAEAHKAAQKKKKQRFEKSKHPKRPVLYVIERGDGPVKIGFTTDLGRRMSEYNEGRSRLIAFCDGNQALERQVHERFAHARIGRTEFFERTDEIDEWIKTLTPVSRDTNVIITGRVPEEREEREEKRGEEIEQNAKKPPPIETTADAIASVTPVATALELFEFWQCELHRRRGVPKVLIAPAAALASARRVLVNASGDMPLAKTAVTGFVGSDHPYWVQRKWALWLLEEPRDFEQARLSAGKTSQVPAGYRTGAAKKISAMVREAQEARERAAAEKPEDTDASA